MRRCFYLFAIIALAGCGDDDNGAKVDAHADADATDASDTTDDAIDDAAPDADGTGDVAADTGDSGDSADTGDGADSDTGGVLDDQDEDGLSDAIEAELGTDPTLADSDADGYWDGWEVTAGSDPLDPLATPALVTPDGDPYILDLVDIVEPSLLRSFLANILDKWPPILLFIDAPESDRPNDLVLKGGIATRTSLGADDTAGTADDEYGLRLGSLDPKTGAFQVLLDGTRSGDEIVASADDVVIDLSNVSELVRGVKLRVEDVRFEATFVDGGQRLEPTRLAGILSRAGVEDILENADLPLPIDIETAMQLLDPDGDGIIAVDISLKGRPAISSGWSLTPDAEPAPRDPGECCGTLAVGDAIDPVLVIEDQGIQPSEEKLAMEVVHSVLGQPTLLDFVAALRVVAGERRIYVYSPRGNVYFTREHLVVEGQQRTLYRVYLLADADALEGEELTLGDPRNPIANQNAFAIYDYETFLLNGVPFATNADYQALGYAPGDERLVHVAAGANPYPFGYERLAQIFDDPRAGDLFVEELSYIGNHGSHGHLSALQSRSPLILSGPGVVTAVTGPAWSQECLGPCGDDAPSYLVREDAAHIVDVAPTLAKALGVTTRTGVNANGRIALDNFLAWQDGRALDEVLDGTHAEHALILVNDGLTSMELLHQAFDPARDLDAYRELMARGVTFRGGAITNFPSNTYPSHNVIGSGAYSGHHGLVDNSFYEREVMASFAPITELFSTEKFLQSAQPNLPIETLHEAVLRSFGGIWDKVTNPGGVLTASLNDPSTRGAPIATLERRVPEGYVVPAATDHLELGGTTWTYPAADLLDAEGLLDNSTVTNAYGLFITNPAKGFPTPRYAVINLSSTDGAGHKAGPHGDLLRESVLKSTNDRLRIILEILKQAGLFESTLIVLTADHGMELKDPNVGGTLLSELPDDVAIVHEHDFVYLKQLTVAHSGSGTITFTVSDTDGSAPLNLIGGATVVVSRDGTEVARGSTAPDGTVVLAIPAGSGALVATVIKTGFSTENHPL